ncbi:MAG: energy-coupling factor transporter ATPase, partial [Selenomonadaceae bacterium]|nr:energy-coupling factor transporter ATPase [Selenomonadaceae bacterium]
AGREKMLKEIRALHKKHGFTIVLVSHSMEDIARFAERMLVLRNGTCVLDDAPSNVFRQTEMLEQSGLRPPQVTRFLQMLRQKGLDVSMDAITFEEGLKAILKAVQQ